MFRQSVRSFSSTAKTQLAKMQLIGTIGGDLTKQTSSSGREYIRYSIAVNSKNGDNQITSWYNVACFIKPQIEYMEKYIGKGAKVFIEAEVTNTSYEKSDGTKSTSLMLFQNNVEVIKYPKTEGESA